MKSRNTILRSSILAVGLGTALLVITGGCPELNNETSDFRFVNMSTHSLLNPSEGVIDGTSSGPISRFQASGYTTRPSTKTTMEIRDSSGGTVYSNNSYYAPDNSVCNIVSVGTTHNPDVVEVAIPRTEPQPGANEVIFHIVNGLPGSTVDVYFLPVSTPASAGTPSITGLNYLSQTVFATNITNPVNPGPKDLSNDFDIVVTEHGSFAEKTRLTVTPTTGTRYLATLTAQLPASETKTSDSLIHILTFQNIMTN